MLCKRNVFFIVCLRMKAVSSALLLSVTARQFFCCLSVTALTFAPLTPIMCRVGR